ncbi:MAG: peroxiredoxin [Bacilli bacterium]|jgi:peroxiredoxin Q/BCP|nr:peroxiredoxin [Bacilli bacterium]MDY0363902.1 peroxiredoxin [Bacilli bacterium]
MILNKKIEDFTLPNELGEEISLSNFLGKKVVIYFYPKDFTPGCEQQACSFRNLDKEYKELDTIVIGISKDTVASHKKFKEKFNLPFILLSDPERKILKKFNVIVEKKMFGKSVLGTSRDTYILNEKHELVKIYKKVDPKDNANEILEFLKTI